MKGKYKMCDIRLNDKSIENLLLALRKTDFNGTMLVNLFTKTGCEVMCEVLEDFDDTIHWNGTFKDFIDNEVYKSNIYTWNLKEFKVEHKKITIVIF